MSKRLALRFAAILPLALAAEPAFAQPAAGVQLAPHRAVYELTLKQRRGSGGNGVSEVRGRIVYEFTGDACDGYGVNFRQVTEIGNGEGQTNVSDLRSETWEDGSGKSFKFTAKNFLNDQLDRDTDGKAERKPDSVNVTVSKPASVSNTYESAVLFPTEHLMKIIEAARHEKKLVEAPVYDGSEAGDKSYDTLTVIGREATQPPADIEPQAKLPELEKEAFWPVAVSYFERGKKTEGEQTPDYQMSFKLYANGVSRDLQIDYGDFVVDGQLKELQFLKASACKK